MKRTAILILAIMLVMAMFVGCSSAPAPEVKEEAPVAEAPSAPDDEEEVVDEGDDYAYPGAVGKTATLILKDLTNPVWILAAEGAKAAAAEFGIIIECVAPVESNNNDEQISLAQQVIAQKKDILIMIPSDSTGIVPVIEEVNAAGIPVNNMNTRISKDSGNAQY